MREQRKLVAVVMFAAVLAMVVFLPCLVNAGGKAPIPPAWSQKLVGTQRFVIVLDGAGVLDKETGLVWEQSPSQASYTWVDALDHCYNLVAGGRKGWHLPTIEQLASLVDTSAGSPTLPAGHPFDTNCSTGGCVQPVIYRSATTDAADPGFAWYVYFLNGLVTVNYKTSDNFAWCVRGGQGYDGQ